MPGVQSHDRGDLYVRVMLEVPLKLTSQQKAILEEYARVSGEKIEESGSLKEKLKKVFK